MVRHLSKDVSNIVINGKNGKVMPYKYAGVRCKDVDEGQISLRDRAGVILGAHGRCQMCGKSVEQHGIALVVDHKKPRDWGGTNDRENLRAICEESNVGKRARFSSLHVDAELMKNTMAHESVHMRIGELLKAVGVDKPTSSQLIAVVADQDDWQKRLRELRHPVFGWEIDTKLYRMASGKKQCDYILRSFKAWPAVTDLALSARSLASGKAPRSLSRS